MILKYISELLFFWKPERSKKHVLQVDAGRHKTRVTDIRTMKLTDKQLRSGSYPRSFTLWLLRLIFAIISILVR